MANPQEQAPGLGDRLERKVVFRFSAAVLRILAGLATLLVVGGVVAVVYFSIPPAQPVPQPEPAKALRVAFHRIHTMTPDSLPDELRLTWSDVLSGALAIAKEGGATPAERSQTVETYAKAIVAKEERRLADGAGLMAEYRKKVEARERAGRAAQAAYENELEVKRASRLQTLYGVGAAASAIISLSLLLALLAIERHLRAMREMAAGKAGRGERLVPPPLPASRGGVSPTPGPNPGPNRPSGGL